MVSFTFRPLYLLHPLGGQLGPTEALDVMVKGRILSPP